jgi:hypothetical protein
VLKERGSSIEGSKYFNLFFTIYFSRNRTDTVALFSQTVQLGKQETRMFRTPATVIGLAGAAFLAGSLAPDAFSIATFARSDPASLHGASRQQVVASAKADRAAAPVPVGDRPTVSTVELVGIAQATVILRDRDGRVLYKSDPQAGATTFTKNADLPLVTLKEETRGPAEQHPVVRREGSEMPSVAPKKRRNPVGCMGDVSPLARASADRTPSLCLALLDHSLS